MAIKVNIKDVRQLEATLVEKYNVGKSLPGQGNFDDFTDFGSYRINGSYTNAPNSTCGTNASLTAFMIGTLNVFALGDNTAAITQQLFWLKDEVVNQYQRSYYNNGSNMTWTDWKKLIKCDDYATDTEVGGIKIGFTPDAGSPGNLPVQLGINDGINDNLNKAFVAMTSRNIKQTLGINNSTEFNGDDIFTSGIPTPPSNESSSSGNFNEIFHIGSYRVYGSYSNAPNSVCGTSTGITASMVGALNVFRSGANDWELIQQLFWVQSGVVEQYQRSFNGTNNGGIWTVWKRLIKCDDFATLGRGGIISEANFGELFRAPDLIQLWNKNELSLAGEVYYLNNLSIETPIKNTIKIDSVTGKDITELTSERRYRVTYEVHCEINRGDKGGVGEVTIKIKNGNKELYSATEYISDSEIRKSITFSVIITGTEVITPSIEVGSELTITIPIHYYQVSIEEIKFPYFTPVQ